MSFWPCPTCETSNAAVATRCDVCGARQPPAAALPKTPGTARLQLLQFMARASAALRRWLRW
jgi:hypothetical protein